MKKLAKIMIVGAALLAVGATSATALAASGGGPGRMAAGFGSRTSASGQAAAQTPEERAALQAQCLDRMKAALDAKVAAGTMTQAQEDEFLAAMKERQAACDGTGYGMMGGAGAGYGCGMARSR